MVPQPKLHKLLCLVSALLVLGACAKSSSSDSGSGSAPDREPSSVDLVRGRVVASLVQASSCDDLLDRIQDDVAAKIELQAEQLKRGESYASNDTGGNGG